MKSLSTDRQMDRLTPPIFVGRGVLIDKTEHIGFNNNLI